MFNLLILSYRHSSDILFTLFQNITVTGDLQHWLTLQWDDKLIYYIITSKSIYSKYCIWGCQRSSNYISLTFEFDSLSAVAVNSTVFLANKTPAVIRNTCCQHVKSNLCPVLADMKVISAHAWKVISLDCDRQKCTCFECSRIKISMYPEKPFTEKPMCCSDFNFLFFFFLFFTFLLNGNLLPWNFDII